MKRILLLVVLVGFTAILVRHPGRTRTQSAAARAVPSADRLFAYRLSSAPSVAAVSAWESAVSADPKWQRAAHEIAGRFSVSTGTNRPVGVTAHTDRSAGVRDRRQADALRRLQQQVGPSLQTFLRADNSTPIQIKGTPLARAASGVDEVSARNQTTAMSFLRQNADLLLIHDPAAELKVAHQEVDALGYTTLRFTQHYRGLQVWPAELGVHLDPQGTIVVVDGAYVPTPSEVSVQPAVTEARAQARARESVSTGSPGSITTPQLIIYALLDKPPRLGWRLEVATGVDHYWSIVIDAQNGAVIRAVDLCASDNVLGSGLDGLGHTVPLDVWRSGGTYYMWNTSKPMFDPAKQTGVIVIEDARNATKDQVLVNNTIQNITDVTSATPTSWSNPDAVSAAFNFSETYDYYRERFNRSSYDGNRADMVAVVRIGGLPNAFWHPQHRMMFFGNADRYAVSLDVIGHELTHGVINSIGSQGILDYQGQSGALNEAFADIFGEMVEARSRGTNDWILGSQLLTPARNMARPAQYGQPSRMSEYLNTEDDFGGVHENSGIIDHAYYLVAAGLKGAIGNRDAERIFYRSLTQYLKPLSQFADARFACIAAAEDLFGTGSLQAIKTAEAFDAVEIYASPANLEPASSSKAAVQAPDSAVFIREHWFWNRDDLWRREVARGDTTSGTSLATGLALSRPTVSGDGADMYFVGSDHGLAYMTTKGASFSTSYAGLVHSVAASPEGHYVAFVFNTAGGNPTNQIWLYDARSNLSVTVNLQTPVLDSSPISNINYADALDFSPDGRYLIYDALSSVRRADGKLRQAWSIFAIDMATLQQKTIVPPDRDFQIGNPAFSQTSDRFIVFDAQYTNGNSAVVTLDLFQGTLGLVGVSYSGLGYPGFNGDDSCVIYADQDTSTSSGRSILQQYLSADKMGTSGNPGLWLKDAKLGVIYRRGSYASVNNAPWITVTSPAANAAYTAPVTVTLTATAGDIDGSVKRVDFYSGSRLLGSVSSSPYTFSLPNLAAGVYRVSAVAFDDQGAWTAAPTRVFVVKAASPSGVLSRPGAPGFEFSLKIAVAGLYRLEASTNLVDWVPLTSPWCPADFGYVDPQATNYSMRFYRAVTTP